MSETTSSHTHSHATGAAEHHSHSPCEHHQSTHSHHHSAPGGFKEANRQHFDSQAHAQGYEANPMAILLAKKCSEAILQAFPFDEEKTVVMDYACGIGLLSQALAPHTKTLVGVDISPKSVAYYNERVANQGISEDEMRAISVELTERAGDEPDALNGTEFDVIVCTNSYHHFEDINATTKVLASYLKPGTGTLLVADLIHSRASETLHKKHDHVVPHKGGFEEEAIRSAFVDVAGLKDFSFKVAFQITNEEKSVDLFIAKGVRPGV